MKTYKNQTNHFGTYTSPTTAQRQSMPDRCFLIPGKKKYPICSVHGKPASPGRRAATPAVRQYDVTCDALRAAYRRANLVYLDPRPHKGRKDAAVARAFAGQYLEKLGCNHKHKGSSKFG